MNKTKIFVIFFSIASMMFSVTPTYAMPQINSAETNVAITSRAYDIRWRYKESGGKLYKRLYNYSRDEWVGEWIYVKTL